MTDEQVCGWTIYHQTVDYPEHIVVRRWWVTVECSVAHHPVGIVCRSLEEAREQVPAGTICFPREPEDDPVVIETWI